MVWVHAALRLDIANDRGQASNDRIVRITAAAGS
jgi:hypothetical protein